MALLNYSTSIEAVKTVGEIQGILAGHGARSILIDYAKDGSVEALAFKIETQQGTRGFKLPIDPDSVLKVLTKQNVPKVYQNKAQAIRVAWRIVKTWVAAQLAFQETEMVNMEQVFLGYMINRSGKSLYEAMVDQNFQITQGKE